MKAKIYPAAFFFSLTFAYQSAYALDTGNIYRFENSDSLFHASIILESERRTYDINSPALLAGIAEAINADDALADKVKNKTQVSGTLTSYNLFFRTHLFIGKQMSIFGEAGIYDDVDAVISPPFMAGGGALITQEIFPDVTLSIVGKGHITEAYRYQIYSDLGSEIGDYNFHIQGRFITATMAAIISTRIPLASVVIYPYIGGEASLSRSQATLKEFEIPQASVSLLRHVNSNSRQLTVTQTEMFYMILGFTIRRPNNATVRIETKLSPTDSTLSLGIGLML